MKIPYYSLNEYLKDTFGCKVYRIAIDAGFTCPNRDGKIGTGGCIFCSVGGSGDFAGNRIMSITDQIEAGKAAVQKKMPQNGLHKYIAYFQAFTNTYGPIEELETKYTEAIRHNDVCAISIATRPDCLDENIISLLDKLNHIKPVWIELGLQTIHDSTARYIRRGYELPVYESAVTALKAANLNIITHVIIGLPGESKSQMLETVDYVGKSGSDGIKLQLLHVLKNTDLEKDYLEGKFKTLEEDEYVDIICKAVSLLPKSMVIHRLTGDGDKKLLVAPMWSANKKHVLNKLNKYLEPVSKREIVNYMS